MIRALVVDDDDDVRFTVRVALEGAPPPDGEPMEVVEAAEGRSALEILATGGIDVVLLDVMMPGPNGMEVLHAIRRGGYGEVAVIMLTARGRESDVAEALRAGADAYVTKPFEVDDLARLTVAVAEETPAERHGRRMRELSRTELLLQLEHSFGDTPGDRAHRREV